jgi:alpha-D-xyloside xylohydrolase
MDFPEDANVRDLGDQYMFGPSFLVAPVTEFQARTRSVYLPAGTRWYDFHTGAAHEGGQRIDASAPLARMPLFVRAGAIIPTGPDVQYASENLGGPLTLFVYTGADGSFDLYEDDGETYAHQRGEFARIPIVYSEATGVLTIGAREGGYPGMTEGRDIRVRWISGPNPNAANFTTRPDASVRYTGEAVTLRRPTQAR